jgi:hypothetical protein
MMRKRERMFVPRGRVQGHAWTTCSNASRRPYRLNNMGHS